MRLERDPLYNGIERNRTLHSRAKHLLYNGNEREQSEVSMVTSDQRFSCIHVSSYPYPTTNGAPCTPLGIWLFKHLISCTNNNIILNYHIIWNTKCHSRRWFVLIVTGSKRECVELSSAKCRWWDREWELFSMVTCGIRTDSEHDIYREEQKTFSEGFLVM